MIRNRQEEGLLKGEAISFKANPSIAFERGGLLLVIIGAPETEWASIYGRLRNAAWPITILARSDQQARLLGLAHVECWSVDRLGPRGFLALIRRISWRRFDQVIDPWPLAFGFLRFWVWPRPRWRLGQGLTDLPVDFSKNSPKH